MFTIILKYTILKYIIVNNASVNIFVHVSCIPVLHFIYMNEKLNYWNKRYLQRNEKGVRGRCKRTAECKRQGKRELEVSEMGTRGRREGQWGKGVQGCVRKRE